MNGNLGAVTPSRAVAYQASLTGRIIAPQALPGRRRGGGWAALGLVVSSVGLWAALGGCASGQPGSAWDELGTQRTSGLPTSSSAVVTRQASSAASPSADSVGGLASTQDQSTASASSELVSSGTTSNSGSGSGSGTSSDIPDPLPPNAMLACGVSVQRVSINQSVEITLSEDNVERPMSQMRRYVWQNRRSLVRVYVHNHGAIAKHLRVTLHLSSGAQSWKATMPLTLSASSTQANMGSTANFVVPREQIGAQTSYRVWVEQQTPCEPGSGDRPRAPTEGSWKLGAQRAPDMEVQLVRLGVQGQTPPPPLHARTLENLRAAILARFPLAKVELVGAQDPPLELVSGQDSQSNLGWRMLGRLRSAQLQAKRKGVHRHFVGLANLGGDDDGIVWYAPTPTHGVALVDLAPAAQSASEDALVSRAVRLMGRMQGLDPRFCESGLSSGPKGKIGVWGFDARSDQKLSPLEYFDLSCDDRPDWINRSSYAALELRARTLQTQVRARSSATQP